MAFSDKPPRLTIRNLTNGQSLTAQCNPPDFEEGIDVNYNRLEVPGMGHQVLQYKNTSNYKLDFELEFLAQTRADMMLLDTARKFLFALGYPTKADLVASGAPPRVLFTWPGMVSVSAAMMKLGIKHDRFNIQAKAYHYKAKITLEEIRDVRLLMDDVFTQGLMRSTGAAPGPSSGTSGTGSK